MSPKDIRMLSTAAEIVAASESMADADIGESESELREINDLLEAMADQPSNYKRGFLEGRAFEITRGMAVHPDWWTHACSCGECMDY